MGVGTQLYKIVEGISDEKCLYGKRLSIWWVSARN